MFPQKDAYPLGMKSGNRRGEGLFVFVCSIKAGKKRWIIVALAVILAAVTVFLAAGKWNAAAGTGNEKGYICTASTNDERIAFWHNLAGK